MARDTRGIDTDYFGGKRSYVTQPGRPVMPSVSDIMESVKSNNTILDDLMSPTAAEDKDFEMDTRMQTTTSSNPAKPRTLQAGYDYASGTMTVVFRDGTWWEYKGVPPELWDGFKSAESKGKYLRSSGLDGWSNMGPADVTKMPLHRRVKMNGLTQLAERLYGSGEADWANPAAFRNK
jgi:hypothetical protein